jgi:hypothetical protein
MSAISAAVPAPMNAWVASWTVETFSVSTQSRMSVATRATCPVRRCPVEGLLEGTEDVFGAGVPGDPLLGNHVPLALVENPLVVRLDLLVLGVGVREIEVRQPPEFRWAHPPGLPGVFIVVENVLAVAILQKIQPVSMASIDCWTSR